MKHWFKTHAPWVILMLFVSIESSVGDMAVNEIDLPFLDKIVHFCIFAALGWFLARGMYLARTGALSRHYGLWAMLIGTVFGASDEWHQSFVPGRHADWADLLADVLGIISAVILYNVFQKRKRL